MQLGGAGGVEVGGGGGADRSGVGGGACAGGGGECGPGRLVQIAPGVSDLRAEIYIDDFCLKSGWPMARLEAALRKWQISARSVGRLLRAFDV